MPYITSEEAYLMHHGVKGMKWGVRKDRSSGGNKMGAGRKALMGVGKAAMHIPGAKAAVNTGFKRAGLNTTYQKEKAKVDEAKKAAKAKAKAEKKTFKQKMVEKHGAADADVEGDPNNYSWNRKASAKAAAKAEKAANKEGLGAKVKNSAKGVVKDTKDYINKPLTERLGDDIRAYNKQNAIAGMAYAGSILATATGHQKVGDLMSTVGDSMMLKAQKEVEIAIKGDLAISAGKVAYKGAKAGAQAIKNKKKQGA